MAKGLDLSMDRLYVNLDKYGNTSAASVPIALAEAVNEGRVQVGDRIVFVAFGAGFTSGAVAMEWTADPVRGRDADDAIRPEDVRRPAARRLGLGRPDPAGPRRDPRPAAPRATSTCPTSCPGEPERVHQPVR